MLTGFYFCFGLLFISMALRLIKQLTSALYFKFFCRNLKIDFNKKAVLITGCDSGLGYNFAVHLHNKGIHVFAGVYNVSSPGAKSLHNLNIPVLSLDVTDSESIQQASDVIKESIKKNNFDFFGLVNNAGIMIVGEFEWLTEEMINKHISVNLIGPMKMIKSFLPLLRQQKGRIVNISSHCAGFPLPGMSVYSASKSGIRAFSLGLDRELQKFGVRVIQLVPGSFITHSCIMSQQKELSAIMLDNMSDNVRCLYQDYFKRYTNYLASLPIPDSLSPPQIIQDPRLYKKLEFAIFSPYPQSIYINEPPRYFLYYTLFSFLPNGYIKDYLVKKFIKMPEWDDNFNKMFVK